LAYQQHESKIQEQRRIASGLPRPSSGTNVLRAGAARHSTPMPPACEPAGEDPSDFSDSDDSSTKLSKRLDIALNQLQLRIRNDIREELRGLTKMREELRELPARILADLGRVEAGQQQKACHVEDVNPSDSRKTMPSMSGIKRQESRLVSNPTVGTDFHVSSVSTSSGSPSGTPVNQVESISPTHGIGLEDTVGCGSVASAEDRADSQRGSAKPKSSKMLPGMVDEELPTPRLQTSSNYCQMSIREHQLGMWARTRSEASETDYQEGDKEDDDDDKGSRLEPPRRISQSQARHETQPMEDERLPPKGCRRHISRFVQGASFDYISGALVVLNAITLGLQTDWQARHVTAEVPMGFRVIEIFFCVVFTLEVLLRIVGYGCDFFARQHVMWHLFDSFLVITQLLEEFMRAIESLGWIETADESGKSSSGGSAVTSNLGVLRVVRILRLIRVMRLMRIVRLVGELRTLVSSIVGSLKSLIWAVALLFLMMYVMGVYLTQLILDHRLEQRDAPINEDMLMLVRYYGSLGDTVLTVYMSIFGGIDWGDILAPLRTQISVFLTPFFMFYIAFATLCMLNVITGVFVESALLTAKQDQDTYMISTVQVVFDDYDLDRNGRMSFLEFQKSLTSPEMKQVLTLLEIDMSEAHGLFDLLDRENIGSISAQDFVLGCARLRGPAKALDLAILMRETDTQRANMLTFLENLETRLTSNQRRLDSFNKGGSPVKKTDSLRSIAYSNEILMTYTAEVEEV